MKKLYLLLLIVFILAGCKTSRNYEKNKTENIVPDSFIFVGMINYRPGIYKYNLHDRQAGFDQKKYSKLWNAKNESVVELSFSKDRKFAFFITASSKGKRGVFPFINNTKIYMIDKNSEKIKFLSEIGSGMQIFTGWESGSSFKVILNSFDSINANQINQHTIAFDTVGEKILDETKIYDIEKDGYPKPAFIDEEINANDNFKIISSGEKLTSIFLIDKSNDDTILVTEVNQKLNKFKFTEDGKYLIFTTLDVKPSNETLYDPDPETSKLFIYSMENRSIKKIFEGGGEKTFFIMDNKVIFDDGFKEKSNIKIYDIINSKLIEQISIEGGCGLRDIPELPDYSA